MFADKCWYCPSHLPSTTTPLTPIFPLLTCCTSHLKLRRSSKLHLPGRRRRYSSLARNPSVRPSGLTPLALWCSERPWIKGWKKVNHPRKLESSLQSQGFQYLRSARRGGFVLPCKNQITDWHLDNGTKWWLDYLPSQRWHVFAHEFDTGFLGATMYKSLARDLEGFLRCPGSLHHQLDLRCVQFDCWIDLAVLHQGFRRFISTCFNHFNHFTFKHQNFLPWCRTRFHRFTLVQLGWDGARSCRQGVVPRKGTSCVSQRGTGSTLQKITVKNEKNIHR